MTKSAKSAIATTPLANLLETMQATTNATTSGLDWIERFAAFGRETQGFIAARIGQDMRTRQAMLHAKDLGEMQHIQAQFFQKAMEDYVEETFRLLGMGKGLTTPNEADNKDIGK